MLGQIGIVGGGRMGSGIALLFALTEFEVVVAEVDSDSAERALRRIEASAKQAIARESTELSLQEIMARLTIVSSVQELPHSAEVVIEAVQEDPESKKQILALIEKCVTGQCLIATNTSSISISVLAEVLEIQERFLGMHFFNPVPSSLLVEVVVGRKTSIDAQKRATSLARRLGKTEIIVHDSPGFATSRLGVLLCIEAIRMLEEGVAEAGEIDKAMELGYKHAMGPLRSTDLVGLDVRLAIAEELASKLGDRFTPPQLLRDKVNEGHLGRKSGQGFYMWENAAK